MTQATDTAITVSIATREGDAPQAPVVLIIRNPITGKETSRSDLFTLTSNTGDVAPSVVRVSPSKAEKSEFPVSLIGVNLPSPEDASVYFGNTLVEVYELEEDKGTGTRLQVKYPLGGFAEVGSMHVRVVNKSNGTEGTMLNAFEFISLPEGPKNPLDCNASKTGGPMPLADVFILLVTALALGLGLRGKRVQEQS